MSYQNISAVVSAADKQAVKDAVASVRTTLGFLVNLTPDERQSLFKAGNSLTFVQDALTGAQNNPGILPGNFNVAEFAKDVQLFNDLSELNTLVAQLGSEIEGTCMAVGSEAMSSATQVYQYVQTAAKTTAGLKPLADKLGERFQKNRGTKPPTPPTP